MYLEFRMSIYFGRFSAPGRSFSTIGVDTVPIERSWGPESACIKTVCIKKRGRGVYPGLKIESSKDSRFPGTT